MPEFKVEIFCPDGPFTEEEIVRMIDDWFVAQLMKGVGYRLICYPDRHGIFHTCRVELISSHLYEGYRPLFKKSGNDSKECICGHNGTTTISHL